MPHHTQGADLDTQSSDPEMCLERGLMNNAEKLTTPDYPVNFES